MKIIAEYDVKTLSIIVKTENYERKITCTNLESYIEEIRRLYMDLKDYSENVKGD